MDLKILTVSHDTRLQVPFQVIHGKRENFTSKVKCNVGLNRWCLSSPYSICGQLIIKVNTYILRIGLNDIEFKCSIDW